MPWSAKYRQNSCLTWTVRIATISGSLAPVIYECEPVEEAFPLWANMGSIVSFGAHPVDGMPVIAVRWDADLQTPPGMMPPKVWNAWLLQVWMPVP